MRVRTDARREAIVAVASAVFREVGYERTTMADVSARLGGSKATLYGYFPSKEALFLAVAKTAGDDSLQPALQRLAAATGDPTTALHDFGMTYLGYLMRPDVLSTHRLVIGEAARSDIGKQFFEAGPQAYRIVLTNYVAEAMRSGRIRHAEPATAAAHLLALLQAEVMPGLMYGLETSVPRVRIKHAVDQAVAVFMAAYGAQARLAGEVSEPAP